MRAAARKILVRARLRAAVIREAMGAHTPTLAASGRRRVFVALAADYGNLGDLAITYAQERFLRHLCPDADIELLPISRTLSDVVRLRHEIRPQDVITIVGGGNTGDMYDDIQYLRELVVKSFPSNRIISFPQTIEFSRTLYGSWARRRAQRAYNCHPALTIFARDSGSKARASQLFPQVEIRSAPDVVLTLDRSTPHMERDGVVVALRSDLEQKLSDAEHATVAEIARLFGDVRVRDTHVGDIRVTASEAEEMLAAFWEDLRSARLVITDRLHGMIFALITSTPCVVFDSGTGKVGQFYRDWLTEDPGVCLVETVDEASIEAACRTALQARPRDDHLRDTFFASFTGPDLFITPPHE